MPIQVVIHVSFDVEGQVELRQLSLQCELQVRRVEGCRSTVKRLQLIGSVLPIRQLVGGIFTATTDRKNAVIFILESVSSMSILSIESTARIIFSSQIDVQFDYYNLYTSTPTCNRTSKVKTYPHKSKISFENHQEDI